MKNNLLILLLSFPFLGISQSIKGNWEGELTIQNFKLPLIFHIDSTQNGLTATMDSPKQGAKGIPTSQISIKEKTLKIEISQIKFEYSGKLISSESIQGNLTQRGQSFPMELKRQTGELKTEKKPQEPNSPFPYNSEEVTFVNPNGGHQLAGTFTFPTTNKKYKTIILISGSGPQNRDEELLGHKPFLVLSDYLTKQGYAVLRYDDRGVSKSTGNFATATSMDFATDVEAAINYLKNRNEVESIGLMGHSEGGMIAPIVASRNLDIAFIVLLAGPGTPIKELLLDQYELIAKANKISDQEIQQTKNFNAKVFDLFIQQKDTNFIKNEIISEQQKLLGDKYDEEQALMMYNQTNTPWFRYFLTFDPKVYLSQVKCPVLAVNGSLDLQVPSEKNLNAIKEILTQSGNNNFKTIELKKLNHLFQKSKTGNPAEYGIIEETFSPSAMRTISEWLTNFGK